MANNPAAKSQKYRLSWPLNAEQLENIDEMFDDLFRQLKDTGQGPGTVIGTFLRTSSATAAGWSTLVLPNAAVKGDIPYASAANIISMLADVATGNALISGGVGLAPSWGKIGLTTHVSGILPVANGGTNAGAFTVGSVVFAGASGTYTQDNANLFWDDANNRLGLGTVAPITTLDIWGTTPDIGLRHNAAADYSSFRFYEGSTQKAVIQHVGSAFGTASRQDDLELFNLSTTGDITLWTNSLLRGAFYASGGASVLGTASDPGAGIFRIDGQIKITGGTPAANQVLTSDANGLATWEPAAGGGEPTEETTTSTGTQNNYDLDAAYTVLRCNNASELTLTGFTVAGSAPTAGDRVTILSVGAGNVLLAHQNTSSTAANRMINTVTSDVTPLAAGFGSATYQYDDTTDRWRLISHTQGAPILVPYSAGDYTANGSMTWTGNNGDESWFDYKYTIIGNQMFVGLQLDAGDIGGTVNIQCQLKLPRAYSASGAGSSFAFIKNNGTRENGRFAVSSGGTNINITKIDQSNFTLQTDALQILGEIFFPLT